MLEFAQDSELIAGRYRVEASLGRGGMGEVHRVAEESTGRRLALKSLLLHRETRDGTLLFRREYHTLAQLKHPSIIEVYEYGVSEGRAYYTMELLGGNDLRALAPLPYGQACRLLRDVASALAFLHARKLIHRDISAGNVRCTEDCSKAKLIDFGALATVGTAAALIGTPPFVPPEARRKQVLDERLDLYGLGALAYWTLTGRHAYPARKFDELEAIWLKPPPAPMDLIPETPPALSELVMSLLSLDAGDRPATAAEVIDRLSAIGGLEPLAEAETVRGYLSSAGMVGRKAQVEQLRVGVEWAARGEGSSILVEAVSGMGKTRLLRELVLEAQVVGATVLKVECSISARLPYSVARTLVEELLAKVPAEGLESVRKHAPVLVSVMPELRERLGSVEDAPPAADALAERARLQQALAALFTEVSDRKVLVLLVDALQRCDESSAALLATLAHEAGKHQLLLALGLRTDERTRAPNALAALRDASLQMPLPALGSADVLELVQELFGKVPNTARLAKWMHAAAGGSPLQCIELARHLVDKNIVRYMDGIWIIPDEVERADLPRSLGAAMDARIAALSSPARALGEALSVHGGTLSLEMCVTLAPQGDEDAVFAALDDLMREEVLVGGDGSYRFRHDQLREALLRGIDPERRLQLHRRIGEALLASSAGAAADREAEVGWHLYRGGDELRGAELLERAGRAMYNRQSIAECVGPLEAALAVYEKDRRWRGRSIELLVMLVRAAFEYDPTVLVPKYQERALTLLREYTGVKLAARLGPFLGRLLSLIVGVGWASLRRALTPAKQRGPPVLKTLLSVVTTYYAAAGIAYRRNDGRTFKQLTQNVTPLRLFERKSPLRFIFGSMDGAIETLLGFKAHAKEGDILNLEVLKTMPAGLSPSDISSLNAVAFGRLAIAESVHGSPAYRSWLEQMDSQGRQPWPKMSLFIVSVYHTVRGEELRAQEVLAQAELREVQLGSWWIPSLWYLVESTAAYGFTRDVIALKRSIERLDRLVKAGLHFARNLDTARGDYHRERGELDESLAAFERALAASPPGVPNGEGLYWPNAMAGLAETLVARGENERALKIAREGSAFCRDSRRGFPLHALRLGRAEALALAATRDFEAAKDLLGRLLPESHALENPAICGQLHDARARIAFLSGDREGYAKHRDEAERWLRSTQNPALIALCKRLCELGGRSPSKPPPAAEN